MKIYITIENDQGVCFYEGKRKAGDSDLESIFEEIAQNFVTENIFCEWCGDVLFKGKSCAFCIEERLMDTNEQEATGN